MRDAVGGDKRGTLTLAMNAKSTPSFLLLITLFVLLLGRSLSNYSESAAQNNVLSLLYQEGFRILRFTAGFCDFLK